MDSADLHLHTNKSDGLLSPGALVRQAVRNKLSAIAITDHDTIDGIEEALFWGRGLGIEIVPGIEFNTDADDGELHILGYFIDHSDKKLVKFIERLKASRFDRIEQMIKKLNALGLKISLEQIQEAAGDTTALGRPHIARALVQMGHVDTVRDAFNKYIGSSCPAYVARYKLKSSEAIETILSSGGVPVLAHPGLLSRPEFINMCIDIGIQGIEVRHSRHTAQQVAKFEKIAERFNLIPTGGSDCHGECNKDGELLMGTITVPYSIVSSLKNRAHLNRKERLRYGRQP